MWVDSYQSNSVFKDAIRNEFGSIVPMLYFECIGSPYTLQESVEAARKGSYIIIVGVVPDKSPLAWTLPGP